MLFKIIFCILFIGFASDIWACNSSEHHSVLSHYNHAKKIFEGKVLKVGNEHKKKFSFIDKKTGVRSILIKFEVLRNYKNCQIKEQIIIGLLPSLYFDFKIGEHYLIYANKSESNDFLLCERGFNKKNLEAMQKHAFLQEIPLKHSGYMVEYSKLGRKWAEGKLKDGLPIGLWKYYAKSGELQLEGNYQDGEEAETWTYFYHTRDQSYRILEDIISGEYYKNTGTYQLLGIDSNLIGQYKNQITYTVGTDTLVEAFFYNQQLISKKVDYQNGLRHGKEQQFNEKGNCFSSYTFEKDLLDGEFFELQSLRAQKNAYLRVEGLYKADKKYNERHLYFENEVHSRTKEVIKGGKLLKS